MFLISLSSFPLTSVVSVFSLSGLCRERAVCVKFECEHRGKHNVNVYCGQLRLKSENLLGIEEAGAVTTKIVSSVESSAALANSEGMSRSSCRCRENGGPCDVNVFMVPNWIGLEA